MASCSIGRRLTKKPKLSSFEVTTFMVLFQLSGIRCIKWFYSQYLAKHMLQEFPNLVSYNRFVELQKKSSFPTAVFAKTCEIGECTGISFVDSTPLIVCKNKRIINHKVFDGIATRGKSTMRYFYGFKLHIVVNEIGQIIDFQITQANVDDRTPLKENLLNKIWGKLYGDKAYVNKSLCEMLFTNGIHLVTGLRKNMKNILMELRDKIILRKRSIIETINDQFKNICMIEHSRHRSFHNFNNKVLAGIIAYSFLPKKSSVKFYEFTPQYPSQLSIF